MSLFYIQKEKIKNGRQENEILIKKLNGSKEPLDFLIIFFSQVNLWNSQKEWMKIKIHQNQGKLNILTKD